MGRGPRSTAVDALGLNEGPRIEIEYLIVARESQQVGIQARANERLVEHRQAPSAAN
jgi:hypothetical protein